MDQNMETDNFNIQRTTLLGTPVDLVNMDSALQWVARQVMEGTYARTVLAVNPEKVIKAQEDSELQEALVHAGLLIPDGIGVVVGLRRSRKRNDQPVSRVAGADLMVEICAQAARLGHRIFLYGAHPDVNSQAASVLRHRFPTLQIAGAVHGYLDEDQQSGLVEQINRSNADILFVALGSPKQEQWMREHCPALNVKVCQGIGGTLDVLAGRVPRAPALFIALHLEWLYRLLRQPRRLFRQTALPRFAFQLLIHRSAC